MTVQDARGLLETGVLYCDDNLARLSTLPSDSIDLIYLDPPFFSNRVYEVIWGDEAEVRSFADRWEGGMQVYIDWMRHRLLEMHRLLKPTGSLSLHCDPHASHYLKVMLDEVFGSLACMRNEVVWKRTGAKGSTMTRLPANHDLILNYVKDASGAAPWKPIQIPYNLAELDAKTKQKYSNRDASGRLYQLTSLLHPEQDRRPNLDYEVMGVRRTWRWSRERMEQAIRDGLVVQSSPGAVPRQKRYLDEQKGRVIDDVWTDINALNSRAAERQGYPTQKPEALLARIIEASTSRGDVVLDPFCGCGTTVTVAQKLGRRWVGIDISPTAVNIMTRRVRTIPGSASPKVVGMPSTVDTLRNLKPFEFQNWVIQQFYGVSSARKSGDMGIDGYTFFTHDPIQVKRSDRVGRNVVDNFETAVKRDGSSAGWIVAFSFTRDAREEAARARWQEKLDIRLVTVADLLKPKAERRGLLWPEPATVTDIPLRGPRNIDDLPSTEDLIESATTTA